jgi:hypothetical protein
MHFVTEGASHRGKSSTDTTRFHDGRHRFVCVGGQIDRALSFGADRGNASMSARLAHVWGLFFVVMHKPTDDPTIGEWRRKCKRGGLVVFLSRS